MSIFFPLSLILHPFFSVQNNSRFERIALHNGRKREAHKEVLLCIPSSIPTPSSPPLFLSPLFFPTLLPLPAQASPASRTSYDQTDTTACLHACCANLQMWESIKNACLAAERKTAYALQRDKGRERAKERHRQSISASQEKKREKTARKQARCWGTERASKNENEVASRAAPSTASEKLHTGVPGP